MRETIAYGVMECSSCGACTYYDVPAERAPRLPKRCRKCGATPPTLHHPKTTPLLARVSP